MPFRLLGLAVHPDDTAALCGQAFARYAESGTEITVLCAAASDPSAEFRQAARRLGVRDLVLLDYAREELIASVLEDVLADVMTSVRPHVVVTEGNGPALRDAAASAFSRVRRAAGGSAALPAKLYHRPQAGDSAIAVTTAVAVRTPRRPELFVRAFPNPWVTGVLERDLFAGLARDASAAPPIQERLAS